jgi:hypothetical protein
MTEYNDDGIDASGSPKKLPTPSERYDTEDADITIISSDDIAFKVHSYHLMSGS